MMIKIHNKLAGESPLLIIKTTACILCALVLHGCSSDNMADLRTYVQSVKARPAGRIPPLPTFEAYVNFPYSAAHLRDPFELYSAEADVAQPQQANSIKPPITHKPEPLEQFPLDSLKYVGLLEKHGETWAIISAPDKLVHRVKVGNYLGQNYGKITSITESKIELTETVSNGLGGWIERPAGLSIAD